MAIADFENEKRTTNFTGERYSVKICIYLGFWRKPGKSADFGGCRGRHFPPSLREKFANFSPYWCEKKAFFFAPRSAIERRKPPLGSTELPERGQALRSGWCASGGGWCASGGGGWCAFWRPELRLSPPFPIFHATTTVKKMQVK